MNSAVLTFAYLATIASALVAVSLRLRSPKTFAHFRSDVEVAGMRLVLMALIASVLGTRIFAADELFTPGELLSEVVLTGIAFGIPAATIHALRPAIAERKAIASVLSVAAGLCCFGPFLAWL